MSIAFPCLEPKRALILGGSFKVPRRIAAMASVSAEAKLVAGVLNGTAYYDSMACWLKIGEIAEKLGMYEHQVRRALNELAALGLIYKIRCHDEDVVEMLRPLGFVPPWEFEGEDWHRGRCVYILAWKIPPDPDEEDAEWAEAFRKEYGSGSWLPNKRRQGRLNLAPEQPAPAPLITGAGAAITGAGAHIYPAPAPLITGAGAGSYKEQIPDVQIPDLKFPELTGRDETIVRGEGKPGEDEAGLDDVRIAKALDLRRRLRAEAYCELRLDGRPGLLAFVPTVRDAAGQPRPVPDDLAEELRAYKPELLAWISAEAQIDGIWPKDPPKDSAVEGFIRSLADPCQPNRVAVAAVALARYIRDAKPRTAWMLVGVCSAVADDLLTVDRVIGAFRESAGPHVDKPANSLSKAFAALMRDVRSARKRPAGGPTFDSAPPAGRTGVSTT